MPLPKRKRKCHHCAGSGTRQVPCFHHDADGEQCNLGKFQTTCSSCHHKWKPGGDPFICQSCLGSSFYRPICPSCNGSALVGIPCQICAGSGESKETLSSLRYNYENFLQLIGKKRKECRDCLGSGKKRVACQYQTANGESCHEGVYVSKCLPCKGTGGNSIEGTICEFCPGSGWQTFTCQSCDGSGSTEQPCQLCDGSGEVDA